MGGYSTGSGGVTVEGTQIIDDTNAEAFLVRQNGDAGDVFVIDTRDPASVLGALTQISVTGNGGNVIVGSADDYKILNLVSSLTSGTQSMMFRGMQCQINATGASVSSGVSGEGLRAAHFATVWDSTGTCAYQDGISCNAVSLGVSSAVLAGAVTLQIGNRVVTGYSGSASGTGSITESDGIYIVGPQNTSAGRTIGTYYGLKIDAAVATGVTTGYSVFTSTGLFRVGGRMQTTQGANVASANDLTLGIDGNFFNITGNTQINAITTANWTAGSIAILIFASNPLVKHNTAGGAGTAKIFLSGSADFSSAANSVLGVVYDGTNWHELFRKVA